MVLASGSNDEYLSSLVPYPVVHLDIRLPEHILKEGSRNNNPLLLPSQRSLRACFCFLICLLPNDFADEFTTEDGSHQLRTIVSC